MLQKKKITRKRNREYKKVFHKLILFIIIFGVTLTLLMISFGGDTHKLLSPISYILDVKGVNVPQTKSTIELKKALNDKKIIFSEIKVSSTGAYLVKLKTGEDVVLSSKKDLGKQLSSLQVIYSRLTMEGRGVRKLDFQYDKPVVVFK